MKSYIENIVRVWCVTEDNDLNKNYYLEMVKLIADIDNIFLSSSFVSPSTSKFWDQFNEVKQAFFRITDHQRVSNTEEAESTRYALNLALISAVEKWYASYRVLCLATDHHSRHLVLALSHTLFTKPNAENPEFQTTLDIFLTKSSSRRFIIAFKNIVSFSQSYPVLAEQHHFKLIPILNDMLKTNCIDNIAQYLRVVKEKIIAHPKFEDLFTDTYKQNQYLEMFRDRFTLLEKYLTELQNSLQSLDDKALLLSHLERVDLSLVNLSNALVKISQSLSISKSTRSDSLDEMQEVDTTLQQFANIVLSVDNRIDASLSMPLTNNFSSLQTLSLTNSELYQAQPSLTNYKYANAASATLHQYLRETYDQDVAASCPTTRLHLNRDRSGDFDVLRNKIFSLLADYQKKKNAQYIKSSKMKNKLEAINIIERLMITAPDARTLTAATYMLIDTLDNPQLMGEKDQRRTLQQGLEKICGKSIAPLFRAAPQHNIADMYRALRDFKRTRKAIIKRLAQACVAHSFIPFTRYQDTPARRKLSECIALLIPEVAVKSFYKDGKPAGLTFCIFNKKQRNFIESGFLFFEELPIKFALHMQQQSHLQNWTRIDINYFQYLPEILEKLAFNDRQRNSDILMLAPYQPFPTRSYILEQRMRSILDLINGDEFSELQKDLQKIYPLAPAVIYMPPRATVVVQPQKEEKYDDDQAILALEWKAYQVPHQKGILKQPAQIKSDEKKVASRATELERRSRFNIDDLDSIQPQRLRFFAEAKIVLFREQQVSDASPSTSPKNAS